MFVFPRFSLTEISSELTLFLRSAFFFSNPPKSIHTPMSFHPPELVFQRRLTEAVDIWNLGCTVRTNKLNLYIN